MSAVQFANAEAVSGRVAQYDGVALDSGGDGDAGVVDGVDNVAERVRLSQVDDGGLSVAVDDLELAALHAVVAIQLVERGGVVHACGGRFDHKRAARKNRVAGSKAGADHLVGGGQVSHGEVV